MTYIAGSCRNGNCPRIATVMVRWYGIGDRAFCDPCHESLSALVGDDMRVIKAQDVPEWRRRDLSRDFSRNPA